MTDGEWSTEELKRFAARFFALCGALGAVALYGRTGALWWPVVAVVAAELARSYAPPGEKGQIRGKVRDFWYWMVYDDPRWKNVPRLAAVRDRGLNFRLKLKPLGVVAMLLLVPSVVANEATDGTLGMMTYPVAAESFNLGPITPISAGEVLNFSYNASRPHAFEVLDHRLVLGVSMTHSVLQNSEGAWNITIYQDGIPLNGCNYIFPTREVGGFLAGEFETYPPYGLSCIRTGSTGLNNNDHNHTIAVEFQVESGTPADIDNTFISFGIQRRDVYLIPDSIEINNLWTFLPVIVAIAVLIIGEVKRDFMYRGIAGLLFVTSMIPMAALFPWYVTGLFGALGMYLVLMFMLNDTETGKRLRKG